MVPGVRCSGDEAGRQSAGRRDPPAVSASVPATVPPVRWPATRATGC